MAKVVASYKQRQAKRRSVSVSWGRSSAREKKWYYTIRQPLRVEIPAKEIKNYSRWASLARADSCRVLFTVFIDSRVASHCFNVKHKFFFPFCVFVFQVNLLAGRTKAIRKFHEHTTGYQDAEINARLVAYCSDQAHSSVEKAALIGLVRMRFIEADENLSLRGPALREAIVEDIKNGLIPFWVSDEWLVVVLFWLGN